MLKKISSTFNEYPQSFKVLAAATFIDRVGGTMIQPFYSLYIAQKFGVNMTTIGLLFGIWAISGVVGNMLGGALTDKIGRKTMLVAGLVLSATSAILMGIVNNLMAFALISTVVGLLSDIAGPARGAMTTDMLPAEKRAEGFGIIRVVGNLAWIVGPALGGLLATKSYMLVFICDAVASIITALIVIWKIPETKPQATEEAEKETLLQTFKGYSQVTSDKLFMAYVIISMLLIFVYSQMYSTLSVYLNQQHAIPAKGYGWLMSMNAILVVLFQFSVTRSTKKKPPMHMMALATLLYGIGFSMIGFVDQYWMFMVAMAIITLGEMVHIPTSSGLIANLAPEDKRGRYNAFANLSWGVPNIFSTFFAGLVMDNLNPNLVWTIAGIICLVTLFGYLLMNQHVQKRLEPITQE
ncbi:MAG: MFS transporter [Pelolinea sp.]|nr:MFS transporter [Pelolinea sp.]